MNYKTPGVFIEEVPSFPPSVVAVETAVPAFIGYTERADETEIGDFEAVDDSGNAAPFGGDNGLHLKPVRISSMLEYERHFGKAKVQGDITVNVDESNVPISAVVADDPGPHHYRMHEALRMYFANGGGPCYVLSVGKHSTVQDSGGANITTQNAIDKAELGVDGGLAKIRKVDEVTLLLFPDAPGLEAAEFYDLYKDALLQCGELKDRFTVVDVLRDDDSITLTNPADQVLRDTLASEHLKYGAAYWPWLKTTLRHRYNIDDIMLVQPDVDGNPGPYNGPLGGLADDLQTDEFKALVRNTVGRLRVEMPPSSSIVGIYAKIDSTRGVWKAPANVSVNNIVEPTLKITNNEQDSLNVHPTGKSINAIRTFTGRGTLVWGARTLDGNSNDFRYVPVRRFLNMVEESVKKATQRFVFEPNDANTWTMVQGMIENFLLLQWRAGALQGAKPEQAFFVRVGIPDTMTALDVLEGRMNVEIGMAIVRPAEFIILKFSHKLPES